jgi:hypothetical protein
MLLRFSDLNLFCLTAKVVRRLMEISPKFIRRCLVMSLIAVSEFVEDDFRRHCIETLRELGRNSDHAESNVRDDPVNIYVTLTLHDDDGHCNSRDEGFRYMFSYHLVDLIFSIFQF